MSWLTELESVVNCLSALTTSVVTFKTTSLPWLSVTSILPTIASTFTLSVHLVIRSLRYESCAVYTKSTRLSVTIAYTFVKVTKGLVLV